MERSSALPNNIVRTSQTRQVILQPAGSTESIQRVPVMGVRFYLIECDSDSAVGIKTDKTSQELFTVGTGKEFTEEQFFAALEVQNFSDDVITITLFVGFGDYIDKRTTIVGNRLSSILPVIEPKTKAFGGDNGTIPAGDGITLPGTPQATMIRRKAITVTNLDPNLHLQIRDIDDVVVLTIFGETSVILPISEPCKIWNPNGSDISLSYGEIFWMKP